MAKDKNGINLEVLKRVVSFAKPYKLQFRLAIAFTFINSFLSSIRPLILGAMVSDFVLGNKSGKLFEFTKNNYSAEQGEGLLLWTLIIVFSLTLEGLLQFGQTYMSNLLGQNIIKDIRISLFKHVSSFNLKYFDNSPVGSLVTRVISDIEAISEIFSQGLITILGDLTKIIIVIILMFLSDWRLSLFCLIPIPLLFLATKIFARAMQNTYKEERTQVNRLNTFVQEHITGMSIVQIFNREKVEYEKFEEINKAHRQAHINAVWAFSIFLPVVELLSSLSIATLVCFGVFQFSSDSNLDSIGTVFSFMLWIHLIYRPIRQMADRFNVLQRGVVRAERVFKSIDEDKTIQNEGNIEVKRFKGNISFSNVHFAYNEPEYVLKNLSFDVKEGETIAFVGATGAGKSTIINLLSRFYEYQKGIITVDNNDLRDYTLNSIRKNIAVVLQDVFLFSDSVINNITLKNPEITKDEVIKAAKLIGAHDFIMKLPNGYDYNVGERGGVLSVGQRQLLAFIRAYVYNPSILVLDEATSSVDTESEELIQTAIEKLTKGRTSIVIAHRLSTIQNASKIIVLDKGEIQEMGSHQELLSKEGHYKNLCDIQFK